MMALRPLIIPFQTEVRVTNNKNTPDKNCVRIAPDYTKVEYTSYLGGKIQPPPFTFGLPLQAGIHLHFILPGCFRRAVQRQDKKSGEYLWDYAAVPDRFLVTRLVTDEKQEIRKKFFIVESNYVGLDNTDSTAIPYLSDSLISHRFLGRNYEYGKEKKGTGEYLDTLTAMGAGDPYFSAYYQNCSSVFGFYDDMSDVEPGSDTAYFITGYFSKKENDPLNCTAEKDFKERLENLGLIVKDKDFYTDNCVLFSEVYHIRWEGYQADYPSGRPTGEIKCGIGNTSAEILSAVIDQALGDEQKMSRERLFDALQYEMADTLGDSDGITLAEDEIHAQTFETVEGGNIWRLKYNDSSEKDLPAGAGFLLAELNENQRACNRKKEELRYWQDAAYGNWYSYMLLYEGDDSPSPEREKMKQEILRICCQELPRLRREAEEADSNAKSCLGRLKKHLEKTEIEVSAVGDEDFYRPKDPVLLLYGEGLNRNYAFTDEGNILCQTSPLEILTDGKVSLDKSVLLTYAGDVPEIIPGYLDLFIQAMCLNSQIVKMIREKEKLPGLACDKTGISDLAGREFRQSWLTLLIEWKISFYPSRTLSEPADDSMRLWEFDGMDYDSSVPNREELVVYAGRTMITPHSLYRFRYVAEKYLTRRGELTPEMKEALKKIEGLPVMSQNLDGINEQFLSRLQTLQVPVIGNDSDEELTAAILENVFTEKLAVNQAIPFFPLRAGHIRLETVNIVNTFGEIQNGFSSGMNPVYTEVMGEYEDTRTGKKYGKLRPRLVQGLRLRSDFVTADDECILAYPAPETNPICGILMPELLNGRLAVYSAQGEYYGCIKTVYRDGKPFAAWNSPPEKSEVPFGEIPFSNAGFKSMISYLLEDSKKNGDAFSALMTLVREQMECAAPAGMGMGEDFPYIWGRPLAVSLYRASMETMGGLPFSQLKEDYGKYNTLSVQDIEFPLIVGDRSRAGSAVVGYYVGGDYSILYPAYHSHEFESEYVKFGKNTCLRADGEGKVLTLISEIGNTLYFQTGILPVVKKKLEAVHTNAIEKIKLCFEADAVICTPDAPMLPVPTAEEDECWYFEYAQQQPGGIKKHKGRIASNVDVFHQERGIICDGYFVLEKKDTSHT
ncbi:hypothetical protein NXH76_08960 [Blautia schinkii]|nr:hypothetical protein [Blautia schinkii]